MANPPLRDLYPAVLPFSNLKILVPVEWNGRVVEQQPKKLKYK